MAMKLLDDQVHHAKFLSGMLVPMKDFTLWRDLMVTWTGHDFPDTVSDDEIWKKTKEGKIGAGEFTIDLLTSLSKGILKKRIEEHTGNEI